MQSILHILIKKSIMIYTCQVNPSRSWGNMCFLEWTYSIVFILSCICGDYIYIRRVLDWQLDLLDHTRLHTITVYTLLQLLTVHYNTCRVYTLYLHWLPVFQYCRIRSPATLQLFSEDSCSARILTHNCSTELWTISVTEWVSEWSEWITTDGQSVSLSWCRAPSGAHNQILITICQYSSVNLLLVLASILSISPYL
jgi:hypothetical protein